MKSKLKMSLLVVLFPVLAYAEPVYMTCPDLQIPFAHEEFMVLSKTGARPTEDAFKNLDGSNLAIWSVQAAGTPPQLIPDSKVEISKIMLFDSSTTQNPTILTRAYAVKFNISTQTTPLGTGFGSAIYHDEESVVCQAMEMQ